MEDEYLLELIFSYVDDLFVCELVCKRWKKIIDREKSWLYREMFNNQGWSDFKFRDSDITDWKERCMIVKRTAKEVQNLYYQTLELFEKSPFDTIEIEPNPPLSLSVLKILEKRYNTEFPNDLLEFLKLCNGFRRNESVDYNLHHFFPFSMNLRASQFFDPNSSLDADFILDEFYLAEPEKLLIQRHQ